MWSFNFTGTPDKVGAAIAAHPAPKTGDVEVAQHAMFQQLAAAGLQQLAMPATCNAIRVNANGSSNDKVLSMTFSVTAVKLEI